ncbi:hypothetical protein VTN77DRAFT_94 [Rasamsonia byssochlamydoides]|uniref:uncharacterized protein n=1 Tax=Rasamsonia byssochlamydoides TaxID=89139 RepID=UPI003742D0C5
MRDLYVVAERGNPQTFTGSNGIITRGNAMAGTICYKNGASTGCTCGQVGPTEALMYRKGTADPIMEQELQQPNNNTPLSKVEHSRFFIVHPMSQEMCVSARGLRLWSVLSRPRGGWLELGWAVSVYIQVGEWTVSRPHDTPERGPSLIEGSHRVILAVGQLN